MEEAIALRPRPRAYLTPSAPQRYLPMETFAPTISERSKQLAAKLRPKASAARFLNVGVPWVLCCMHGVLCPCTPHLEACILTHTHTHQNPAYSSHTHATGHAPARGAVP